MFDGYNTVNTEDAKMAAEQFGAFVRDQSDGEDIEEQEG